MKKCGTVAGYQQHHILDQRPCDACRAEWNAYHRAYRARRKRERLGQACVRGLGWPITDLPGPNVAATRERHSGAGEPNTNQGRS